MSTETPATGDLHLVVGYDGSTPAVRTLAGAVRLLTGRTGDIEVVYIAHLPAVDMLSADAIAGVEESFDEVSKDLHKQASDQLRGHEDRWTFARGDGAVPDVLIATRLRSFRGRAAGWICAGLLLSAVRRPETATSQFIGKIIIIHATDCL